MVRGVSARTGKAGVNLRGERKTLVRAVSTIQRAVRRRRVRKAPARFNASKSQFKINKAVSKAMSRMSETKLVSTTPVNPTAINGQPTEILGSGSNPRIYAWRGVLDTRPSAWDTGLVNLAGIATLQGDAINQHIGNYVYFKKTSINLQLDMVYNDNATKQLQFRMVVCKARQLATPAGEQDLPQTSLFLNQIGNRQGVDSVSSLAMSSFEVMNNPLNKRNWVIYRDQKFFLNNPTSMQQGKYPSRKNFRITLPHYKKTKVATDGSPLDYDSRFLIYIFANVPGALTNAVLPDDFRVTARGTTSFTDN